MAETADAIQECKVIGDGQTRVTSIATDSRDVAPGALFCALPGTRHDGSEFAADAVGRGAAAVLTRTPCDGITVPRMVVSDVRIALADIAALWYGSPGAPVQLVAVTGTNGKTTTADLIMTVADAAGHTGASLGTAGAFVGRTAIDHASARPTTPEAHELRQVLNSLAENGATLIAMEVSSHAMELERVRGLRFAAAAFTNLTEDHLDFHGDMESYFQAKSRLFSELDADAAAAINVDDPYGRRLVGLSQGNVITYGSHESANVHPTALRTAGRVGGLVSTPVGDVSVSTPLVGAFNAQNVMAAIGVAVGLGMPPDAIAEGLAASTAVPGRFEPVLAGQDYSVIVDYAHTPDALENVLATAKDLGRLICVVGCGGDRDRAKRPMMAEIATRLSDLTVFSSDNPRTEDPERILDEIVAGAAPGAAYERIEDRRAAIARAISQAGAGDVVVIAGKGEEPYQEIGGTKYPFDDRVEARRAIEVHAREAEA